ncbi:MAG: diphosphomevalonate decarboxylase [Deltaproteobacteria bacterium]|nr:diphosphomevalonate decarboxylase [Deltaproteobacteria bacterium]
MKREPTSVTAVAHPNIALAKYWGKRTGDGNVPAVPSLSVTLAGMTTTTTVTFDEALAHDELVLDGVTVDPSARPHVRAATMLDRVREASRTTARARVVSANDFPTASGLASSASGFAALALAASRAAGLDLAPAEVAELARRSSASAARSVFGGFAELDGGEGATGAARQVAPGSALDLRLVVCVTTEGAKSTSSTEGMSLTQATSPYYAAWVADAPRVHREMRAALLAGDFVKVGELAEHSALAMHACAMAAGVVYVTGATLAALAEVRAIRAEGIPAFGTIDAGPHLKCIVRSSDLSAVKARLARVPGVLRLIEAAPGEGASVVGAPAGSPRATVAREEARP